MDPTKKFINEAIDAGWKAMMDSLTKAGVGFEDTDVGIYVDMPDGSETLITIGQECFVKGLGK